MGHGPLFMAGDEMVAKYTSGVAINYGFFVGTGCGNTIKHPCHACLYRKLVPDFKGGINKVFFTPRNV